MIADIAVACNFPIDRLMTAFGLPTPASGVLQLTLSAKAGGFVELTYRREVTKSELDALLTELNNAPGPRTMTGVGYFGPDDDTQS